MAVKLFILGLPGSGKSTVARHISKYSRGRQWSTTHINDFAILYRMFQEDTLGQFKPAAYGGFDAHDLTVFDAALGKLEQKVNAYISAAKLEEIILIEFSRNDYEKAFHQFSKEFLQNAYFLYLSVNLDICKERIRARIVQPTTVDDHFVSEYIFEAYYSGDDGQNIPHILERNYAIDEQRVRVINNDSSLEDSSGAIYQFVDAVFALEAHRLRETEPIQIITNLVSNGELKHNC
jgi:adenylate kinase family enzyme